MSRVFRWFMRYGAALLFAFALLQLLVGIIPLIEMIYSETSHMAQHHGYTPEGSGIPFGTQLQILFASIGNAAFPFFGALLIDRFDRWLAVSKREAAE